MTVSFSLSNFKSFKELDFVKLNPLTVVCGTNNSGKSSLIQSLLLMKQSNIENTKATLNTYINEPLFFNGIYTNLGSYTDVVHHHDNQEKIKFAWKISNEVEARHDIEHQTIDSEIVFGVQSILDDKICNQHQTIVNNFCFQDHKSNISFEIIKNDKNFSLKIKNIGYEDLLLKWIHSRYSLYGYTYYDPSYATMISELIQKFSSAKFFKECYVEEVNFSDVQVEFDGIFPNQILIADFARQCHDILKEITKAWSSTNELIIPKYLLIFIETTIEDLNTYLNKNPLKKEKDVINISSEDVEMDTSVLLAKSKDAHPYFYDNKRFSLLDQYTSYRSTVLFLRKFWSGFRYISPIREAPKRFYLFDDLRKVHIGVNGEYTPLVLAVEQEIVIPKYYRCIYQGKQISRYELREQDTLLASVNWWLFDCMKLPRIYSVADIRGVINQVKLHSSGVEVDLPDVGFGISQILPIIVECLRTGQGETIVLEQPEIHLHPSLQSKLADFFVCMAKSSKNLVVETHSEQLINRLCLRIAQEDKSEIKNFTNILFISFDERSKSSVSKLVEVNKYGEIENWPVGFFDENDSRDLLAATLKKRMLDS